MAELLWTTITSRNSIMEIAESLIPYFKSQKKDKRGRIARFASIQDIDYKHEMLGDVNSVIVRVKVLSDLGDWMHDLIIREFREESILDEELRLHNELERRTLKFPNIDPVPLIKIDKLNKHLVYEYNQGEKLHQIELPVELKNFLIGRIFAMIQGEVTNSLDVNEVKNLLKYLLENMPFSKKERENIAQLLEPQYLLLENSMGGYQPCTLFDPDNIEFRTDKSIDIDMRSIYNNTALSLTIPMQRPESMIVDRMSDVASFFYKKALNEFMLTGRVDDTKDDVLLFFEGFNSVATEIGIPSINELYPNGITLDLQMLIVYWILKFKAISQNEDSVLSKDDIRFSYYLLLRNPFSEL